MKFLLLAVALFCGAVNAVPVTDVLTDLGCTSLRDVLIDTGLMATIEALPEVTLFAPTNDALAAAGELPSGDDLVFLLTFHAIAGLAPSSAIENDLLIASIATPEIRFNVYDDPTVYTAQAAPIDLENVDVAADNGLVHVVDAVMFPPLGNLLEVLQSNPDFSTLLLAVETAGLEDVLSGPGPLTAFGPDNVAFDNVPDDFLDDLLANVTALTDVLLYHTVGATAMSAGLSDGDVFVASNGDDLPVVINDNGVFLVEDGYSQVITVDVPATNGVAHRLDRVLLAPVEDTQ